MEAEQIDPPLAAILRGLTPAEAPGLAAVLVAAGLRVLEVPLNRAGALDCIAAIAAAAPPELLVGGGTVLSVEDVDAVHAAGGRLVVAPNCDLAVIAHAVERGMLCAPGVATPTEALAALAAGAHILKLFPAQIIGPAGLRAMREILPAATPLWPVGGIEPGDVRKWVEAGATGFGLGSALYRPGMAPADAARHAAAFVAAWQSCQELL